MGLEVFDGNFVFCGLFLEINCVFLLLNIVFLFFVNSIVLGFSIFYKKSLNKIVVIVIVVISGSVVLFMVIVGFYFFVWKLSLVKKIVSFLSFLRIYNVNGFWGCLCLRWDFVGGVFEEDVGDLVYLSGVFFFNLEELFWVLVYVLGKRGVRVVYKVVLDDGIIVVVWRLGGGGEYWYKEFEVEVKIFV